MQDGSTPLNDSDLVNGSVNHMAFLQNLHAKGITLQEPSSKSVDRYLNFWLPLVDSDPESELIAPPDVAWLWHCHRLAPFRYEAYTKKRYGMILEAKAPFRFHGDGEDGDDEGSSDSVTADAWTTKFSNEPFLLQDGTPLSGKSTGFDLVSSTSRQEMFLWHVSQPRFEDLGFLQDGVKKYHKFLALKQNEKVMPLVPMFQIDLLWHTHNATSFSKYNVHCIQIRGKKFHHDASMDDRSPGALLDLAFHETCILWKEKYGEEYVVEGGMNRGVPPPDFLKESWDPAASQTAAEISVIMAGSNSSGTNKGDQSPWKTPNEQDVTFIKAAAKSRVKGVISNSLITGYVFGKGGKGVGYYSMKTKDVYDILSKRLKKQEAKQRADYDCYVCSSGCCGERVYEQRKRAMEKVLIKTVDMIAYVDCRKKASGPNAPLSDINVKKCKELGMHGNHIVDYPAYTAGYGYAGNVSGNAGVCDTHVNTCTIAAGWDGGTCGRGGCGGAACGSGGCGGGGCGGGGGGCGGGGCGGGGGG